MCAPFPVILTTILLRQQHRLRQVRISGMHRPPPRYPKAEPTHPRYPNACRTLPCKQAGDPPEHAAMVLSARPTRCACTSTTAWSTGRGACVPRALPPSEPGTRLPDGRRAACGVPVARGADKQQHRSQIPQQHECSKCKDVMALSSGPRTSRSSRLLPQRLSRNFMEATTTQ